MEIVLTSIGDDMSRKVFRKVYEESDSPGLACRGGRTKQSFKEQCDINWIMERYNKTGQFPDLVKREGKYGDFSSAGTYQEALNVVRHAEIQFASLSSAVRERFLNDPARFLEFVGDPSNVDEMVELGLATAETIEAPLRAPNDEPKEVPASKKKKPGGSEGSDG